MDCRLRRPNPSGVTRSRLPFTRKRRGDLCYSLCARLGVGPIAASMWGIYVRRPWGRRSSLCRLPGPAISRAKVVADQQPPLAGISGRRANAGERRNGPAWPAPCEVGHTRQSLYCLNEIQLRGGSTRLDHLGKVVGLHRLGKASKKSSPQRIALSKGWRTASLDHHRNREKH